MRPLCLIALLAACEDPTPLELSDVHCDEQNGERDTWTVTPDGPEDVVAYTLFVSDPATGSTGVGGLLDPVWGPHCTAGVVVRVVGYGADGEVLADSGPVGVDPIFVD